MFLSICIECESSLYTYRLYSIWSYFWIYNLLGRKVAIDASMSIYQFLIAVRSDGNVLTNEAGETTR